MTAIQRNILVKYLRQYSAWLKTPQQMAGRVQFREVKTRLETCFVLLGRAECLEVVKAENLTRPTFL